MSKKQAKKKTVKQAKATAKKVKKSPYKMYNVFYTPIPYEVEQIVEARSLEDAVAHVKAFLGDTVESVKGGWELLSNDDLETQFGIKREQSVTKAK